MKIEVEDSIDIDIMLMKRTNEEDEDHSCIGKSKKRDSSSPLPMLLPPPPSSPRSPTSQFEYDSNRVNATHQTLDLDSLHKRYSDAPLDKDEAISSKEYLYYYYK